MPGAHVPARVEQAAVREQGELRIERHQEVLGRPLPALAEREDLGNALELSVGAASRHRQHAPVGDRDQRRVPALAGHLADPLPAPLLEVEHQRVADAAERVILARAAGDEQPPAGQERVTAAEQVDRRLRLRERPARIAPDARAVVLHALAVARAGEDQHVAGVQQRRVDGEDLRVEVEDPPHAGVGCLVDVELQRGRPVAVAVQRDQLRPPAIGDRRERRAGPGVRAPRSPAVVAEPPADRDLPAAAHEQLGASVAVEVGDVGRQAVALLPVRDRPPLAAADAVAAGADEDDLAAGHGNVPDRTLPARDLGPLSPVRPGA